MIISYGTKIKQVSVTFPGNFRKGRHMDKDDAEMEYAMAQVCLNCEKEECTGCTDKKIREEAEAWKQGQSLCRRQKKA